MIVTVTPSPALDLTWHVAALAPGTTHRAQRGEQRAGGKGINVARVAGSLGFPATVVTTALELGADLTASGIPHALVPVQGRLRRTVTVVDDATGAATLISELPDPLSEGEWRRLLLDTTARLGSARVLVVSGSVPGDAPDDLIPRLVAAARAAGVPVIVDTSGPALVAAARAGADLVKPNRDELAAAAGTPDLLEGVAMLLELGAGAVCVSLGEDGMVVVEAERPEILHRATLGRALVGNPTGAGDAAVAAFAAGMTTGRGVAESLGDAVAWAAAAVLAPLAGELGAHPDELRAEVSVSAVEWVGG